VEELFADDPGTPQALTGAGVGGISGTGGSGRTDGPGSTPEAPHVR